MTNSVAIVTGASQGIGRSTAVRLARDFGSILPGYHEPLLAFHDRAIKFAADQIGAES